MSTDRPLPSAIPAEQALLSCLMQDPSATIPLVRARLRDASPMLDPRHQIILTATLYLESKNRAVDLISLGQILERRGRLNDVGGHEYLCAVYSATPTTQLAPDYIEQVMDAYMLRRLIAHGNEVAGHAWAQGAEPNAVIDRAQASLNEIHSLRRRPPSRDMRAIVGDMLDEYIAANQGRGDTVTWGEEHLDQWTRLRPHRQIMVAARLKVGKSAVMTSFSLKQALAGVPVGVITLEMKDKQLGNRYVSLLSGVPFKTLDDGCVGLTSYQNEIVRNAATRLSTLPIHMSEGAPMDLDAIKDKAKEWKLQYGIRCLWIDYAQIINMPKVRNGSMDHESNAKGLKDLTSELDMPVIVLAQLNRFANGDVPQTAHLAGSDLYARNADAVLLLDRPEADGPSSKVRPYHKADGSRYSLTELQGKMVLLGSANRNGGTMFRIETWDGPRMCIGEPPKDSVWRREIPDASIPRPSIPRPHTEPQRDDEEGWA